MKLEIEMNADSNSPRYPTTKLPNNKFKVKPNFFANVINALGQCDKIDGPQSVSKMPTSGQQCDRHWPPLVRGCVINSNHH
jgi:hypothetical protein